MRASKRFSAALTATLLLGAGLSASCAENRQTFFAHGVVLGTRAENGSCTYESQSQAQGTSVTLASGTFDVGLSTAYTMAVEFRSGLVSRADDFTNRAESGNLFVTEVISRVTEAGRTVSEVSTPTYTLVPPQGFGIVAAIGIDSVAAAAYKNLPVGDSRQLMIEITARGETAGGLDTESSPISLPVLVCNGCLVYFPPGSDDPASEGNDCNADPDVEFTGCPVGQDQRVPCTVCRGLPACDPALRTR